MKRTNKASLLEDLKRAVSYGRVGECEYLLKSLAHHKIDDRYPYVALGVRNLKLVQLLVQYGLDVNQPNNLGYTPLITAVHILTPDIMDVIHFLLISGADINHRNRDGYTALHIAALMNRLEIVQLLLQFGVDINQITNKKETALNIAVVHKSMDVFQFLLQSNADVNLKDNWGYSPLYRAAQLTKPEMVLSLLQHHAISNTKTYYGKFPLYIAAERGNLSVIKTLVSFHANIYQTNGTKTPQMIALQNKHFAVANYLESLKRVKWIPGKFISII
jgi:ankyrin repeat protein